MDSLVFDRPGKLNMEVGGRHSFKYRCRQFKDADRTIPVAFTGTHKMVISLNEKGTITPVYTVSTANIMTVEENLLTVDFTTSINKFKPGSYLIDWRSDDGTGHSTHIGSGTIIINSTQATP